MATRQTNTYGRAGRPAPADHGTRARYGARTAPCKCAACRAANAAYQRQYRARARPVDPVYGQQLTLETSWR